MSIVALPIYRTEAGVHSNPAASGQVFTHCNNGTADVLKQYHEVFIHWDGSAWVEDPFFDPLALDTRAALRIDNQCNGSFSLVQTTKEDFRAFGQCCSYIPPVPLGLWLNFNNISVANTLVVDPYNVANWNTFFSMDILAVTPFTSVQVLGNSVVLIGGTGMQFKAGSFNGVSGLVSVADTSNTVIQIQDEAFANSPDLVSVSFPICTIVNLRAFFNSSVVTISFPLLDIISDQGFEGCAGLLTVTLPQLTVVANSGFRDCTSLATLIIPLCETMQGFSLRNCNALAALDARSCVPFGQTTGNDFVFFDVNGATMTITLAASETGDGDIVSVSGTNTVTLVPI